MNDAYVAAELAQRLTLTCNPSGMLKPGMRLMGVPPPFPPRFSWRHPIRTLRALWRWRRIGAFTGEWVITASSAASSYEIAPVHEHRCGCACLTCRNKVM